MINAGDCVSDMVTSNKVNEAVYSDQTAGSIGADTTGKQVYAPSNWHEDNLFFMLSQDIMCIASADGYFKTVNPALIKALGWSNEELLARPFLDFIHPDDRVATLREVEKQTKRGELILLFENRYKHKDGSWRNLSWNSVPQANGLMYAVARDITEQRKVHFELISDRETAHQASRDKSSFLAAMSHEIRTPMNGVVGMADVLAHSALSEHQADLVQTIRSSAEALLRIVDDILDFSKIEAGHMQLDVRPVSVADTIESLCNSLRAVAFGKKVDLTIFIAPEIPERVLTDDMRLRQLLYNLVGNAIKFSGDRSDKRGRVSVRVEVAAVSPFKLQFTVADNGIGMSSVTRTHLFTAFTQAESSTTRRFGGTGLGLAISKRLADLMQGEITIVSRLGEGSVFTVTLPFEIAAEQPRRSLPDLSDVDCILVSGPSLNADDFRAYLEHAGARVQLASDTKTASQFAMRLAKSVIIRHSDRDISAEDVQDAIFAAVPNACHLLIAFGQRQRARLLSSNKVSLDANVMSRQSLLRAVAVAADRMSPEILQNLLPLMPPDQVLLPSVAEARAQGTLILIAEDDVVNQKVILQQLKLLGYTGEVASDGVKALQQWRQGGYALLLTDLHMPNMDGYTLTRSIRLEEPKGQHIPILALTANALHDGKINAREAGVDDYLVKPVRLDTLKVTLMKWLPLENDKSVATLQSAIKIVQKRESSPAIDIAVLHNLVGDDIQTLREILGEFLLSAQRLSTEMQATLVTGDTLNLVEIVHKLKSSSRSVGALNLGDLCADLESAGKVENHDLIAQRMPQFLKVLATVELEITEILMAKSAPAMDAAR